MDDSSEKAKEGFRELVRRRHASFREHMVLMEVSGMMGDLGTLLPLTLAMADQGSIRAGAALLWTSVFNIIGAYQWDIPMPVQPMKTIAAAAITEGLTEGEVSAAGVFAGGAVAFLGLTGLIETVNRVVPRSVVSGIQLGLGIRMIATGIDYMTKNGWTSILAGSLAGLFGIGFSHDPSSKVPVALLIVLVGASIALGNWFARGVDASDFYDSYNVGIGPRTPSRDEWRRGILRAGLPQLPLTTLNSVISVCSLAARLYPERAREESTFPTRRSVSTSVGVMNLVGCFFGAMPSCHGAGGLSGQHRFGARTGASVFMLGLAKIVLVLVLGERNINTAISAFPRSLLGALLALAGAELARTGAKVDGGQTSAIVTAGVTVALSNTGIGAAAGLLAAYAEILSARLFSTPTPDDNLPLQDEEHQSSNDNEALSGLRGDEEEAKCEPRTCPSC